VIGDEFAFGSAPSPEELAGYDLNDLGNAMRLIRLAGGVVLDDGEVDASAARLLYQLGAGWIGFNGRYWDRPFGEELARRMAHLVARKVRGLTAQLIAAHKAPDKEVIRFQNDCGSSGKTAAMLRQAQSYLTVEIDAFDRDPMALNCINGTLKMRLADDGLAVRLHRHDPADRITKMAAVAYEPTAAAPLFERVALDSFPDREELAYFRRACGYGLTGQIREQAFFVCQGRGRDGKSTLLDAMRKALGSYAETGDVQTFLESNVASSSGPSPDLVKLAGDVRFVVLSEPKRGSAWNESRLKSWTSGSPIQARDLNAKPFNFRPTGKLFVECNPFPKPRGDDDGFWRRIKPVLFRKQVPKDEVDQTLPDKIAPAELAGVLNWMLEGLEDWLCGGEGQGGLRPPDTLEGVLEQYRRQSSPFGDWLESNCVYGDAAAGARTLVADLHTDFKEWATDQGHDKPMSARAFGDALSDRQILVTGKDGKGRKVRGPIRLKTPEERAQGAFGLGEPGQGDPSAGGSSVLGEDVRW
jgi:putative DNA primase/helicase